MPAAAEADLLAALDALPAPVALWWRDDDAGREEDNLERLLSIAGAHGVEVALAVVPEWLEEPVVGRITRHLRATVLQHGIAHTDHARAGEKKVELGGAASSARLEQGLVAGREHLAARFGDRFLPVLVPPWNRVAPTLVERLPTLGFTGLSTFGERRTADAPPGLAQVNAHLDLVAWHEGRRPLTLAETLDGLAALVRQAPRGPVGILTHHLVMDRAAFLALDRLLAILQNHPKALLAGARTLFGETA